MNIELNGKTAMVTAASRGIGMAVAHALAAEGVRVAICARGESMLTETFGKLNGEGHYMHVADLTLSGAPQKYFDNTIKAFESIPDIVIHNLGGGAGIGDPLAPIKDWEMIWRLNFGVAIELNNLLIPHMMKNNKGRLIHISSVSGQENYGSAAYCSVKAALNAYIKCMGRIFAKDGVVICGIKPGAVYTKGGHWEKLKKENPERLTKLLEEQLPTNKFSSPEEIANFVLFLCSKYASQSRGSVMAFDGGMGRAFF